MCELLLFTVLLPKCIKVEKRAPRTLNKALPGIIHWSAEGTDPQVACNLALPEPSRTAFPLLLSLPQWPPLKGTSSHFSH